MNGSRRARAEGSHDVEFLGYPLPMDPTVKGACLALAGVATTLLATLVSQAFERRHRRRELAFKLAGEFTLNRFASSKEMIIQSNDVLWFNEYFRRFTFLFDKKRVSPDVITEILAGSPGSDFTPKS